MVLWPFWHSPWPSLRSYDLVFLTVHLVIMLPHVLVNLDVVWVSFCDCVHHVFVFWAPSQKWSPQEITCFTWFFCVFVGVTWCPCAARPSHVSLAFDKWLDGFTRIPWSFFDNGLNYVRYVVDCFSWLFGSVCSLFCFFFWVHVLITFWFHVWPNVTSKTEAKNLTCGHIFRPWRPKVPKCGKRRPKGIPKRPQRPPQRPPTEAQRGPKDPQRSPKDPQRMPKGSPKAPQRTAEDTQRHP